MVQHIEMFDINFIKIEPYEAYSSKVDHFNKFGVMLCKDGMRFEGYPV